MRVVSVIFLMVLTSGINVRPEVKSICEHFGDSAVYDEGSEMCHYKIGADPVLEGFFLNGSLHCGNGVRLSIPYGFDEGQLGHCECDEYLVPDSNRTRCIVGKLLQEPCHSEANIYCNKYAGLECSKERKCACANASAVWNSTDSLCYSDKDCSARRSSSYFDQDSGQCYLPLNGGGLCGFEESRRVTTRAPKEPICPPNSHCDYGIFANGNGAGTICKCDPGFTSDRTGITGRNCIPVQIDGEPCTDSNSTVRLDCDTDHGLECVGGRCECKSGTIYERPLGHCRVPVGSPCASWHRAPEHTMCGRNVNCVRHSVPSVSSEYGFEAKTTCQCILGYKPIGGFCFRFHGDPCQRTLDCASGMNCVDRLCACANPLRQKVSDDKESCVNLAGSPCRPQQRLTTNAFCLNGTTTCPFDQVTSVGGECLLPHGGRCDGFGARCNFLQGLACIDDTCRCVDDTLRYVDGVGCVAGVGTLCGEVFPVSSESAQCQDDKYVIRCDSPSVCIPVTKTISKCTLLGENSKK